VLDKAATIACLHDILLARLSTELLLLEAVYISFGQTQVFILSKVIAFIRTLKGLDVL
jgi:hypothetical protein